MQEAGDVFRCKLNPHRSPEGVETEDVQIFIEVTQTGRQRDRFDAGCFRALRQNCHHRASGSIGVAGDSTSRRKLNGKSIAPR